MVAWLKRQTDKIDSPKLDWVQMEITTHCNGACIYCPHTLMKDRWVSRNMPLELFSEATPFLGRTDLVYLQGWGEPLLHDDLFEMIRICKNQGKRVGFTTNGMLLTEKTVQILIDLQLDLIGISLAGTTSSTHNEIRKGTHFDKIISNLVCLREIKANRKAHVPAIHLAYLMLKSNFHELMEILPLANEVGAKQIVASNLTLILDSKLSGEAIFNDPGRAPYYGSKLNQIREEAAPQDVVFDYHGLGLDDASLICRENVGRACVISVKGDVVPCVFTNPVLFEGPESRVRKPAFHTFKGQSVPLSGIVFGNIWNESLTRIWNKKEYASFRRLFDAHPRRQPDRILSEMPQCCVTCYKRLET